MILPGVWTRSTRTATTPRPTTTTPTWSINDLVTRTTSTLRTGNLLLGSVRIITGVGWGYDSVFCQLE